MVTITAFMGKLKVHIRQFYVNQKGEKIPDKNEIVLELDEFNPILPRLLNTLQTRGAYFTPPLLIRLFFILEA